MTYEIILSLLVGLIIGVAFGRRTESDWRHHKVRYTGQIAQYEANVQYYKKLTRNLVEENNNLKQWQRRQLDVIESLTKEQK